MEETNTNQASETKKVDARKQSLYFPGDMLAEMKAEAERLDRSLSWVVQRAWKLAKGAIANEAGVDKSPTPVFFQEEE